tara:strand:- start:35262 stop:36083 length:822 start_codon:yes stop_codon:yes gene_type:complete
MACLSLDVAAQSPYYTCDISQTVTKETPMSWKTALQTEYPNAIDWTSLINTTGKALAGKGFTPKNTLLTNISCRDEVNATSVDAFSKYWGENFNLSGLGGYPSGGLTGFTAYSHHVPEGGNLFVFFGPHIGISPEGELCLVQRRGRHQPGAACGSLLGFLSKVQANRDYTPKLTSIDPEQYLVESALIQRADKFLNAANPGKAVTEEMYHAIQEQTYTILDALGFEGPIALLGGIFVNTPLDEDDYFAPRHAAIINYNGQNGVKHDWYTECFS